MQNVSYFVDMNYDTWNKGKTYSLEEFVAFADEGKRYYVGFEKDRFGERPEIRLLTTVDGINKESLFEWLLYKTRKKPSPLYILKYEASRL